MPAWQNPDTSTNRSARVNNRLTQLPQPGHRTQGHSLQNHAKGNTGTVEELNNLRVKNTDRERFVTARPPFLHDADYLPL